MQRQRLLIVAFTLVILVGALHILASLFYLYWDTVWFDSLMHFLGALAIGFLSLWIWFVSGLFGRGTPSKKEVFLTVIVAVMIVALGWEYFEYTHGMTNPVGGNYPMDTFNDLLFDFLGAITVGIAGRLRSFYE